METKGTINFDGVEPRTSGAAVGEGEARTRLRRAASLASPGCGVPPSDARLLPSTPTRPRRAESDLLVARGFLPATGVLPGLLLVELGVRLCTERQRRIGTHVCRRV